MTGPAILLRNLGVPGVNWLTIDLGVMPGAKVRLETPAGEQYGYATTAGSYQSASDHRLHFGLGTAGAASQIEVKWPSGRVTAVREVKAGGIFQVKEPESSTLTER
jgi:hypothetical protein